MKPQTLTEAVEMAARVGYVFIASADLSGRPHLAAARRLSLGAENQVVVSDWLCPETVINLQNNRFISLVAWDAAADQGFQVLGKLREMKDLEMLNGYSPDLEKKGPIPQVDRELVVQVDQILEFKIAPHSDVEE
ncbi:MAG: pyridoxamine 5'-phosphate oxidase family protein [Desulfobacteraceae bacterium]|nr:MAG: pyridoxamine 5'-phosphate oxidase family protein [Desulfobacteraceae bacterium]